MKLDMTDKVALVTGAARGIGRACALALAQQGADIALGLRDKKSAEDLVSEIQALGRKVLSLQMDVAKLEEISISVAEVKAHFGKLDILVNNAGIGAPNRAELVSEKDFDETVNVNLKGTFFTSQEVGKVMIEQRSGVIINLSSQAGFIALPTESIYCMTKAGISHLTRCLALEWAQHGIRVNAVAPTFIKTPGTRKWLNDDAFIASVKARIPLGDVGEPQDVASAVVFLASEGARMITGETLMIDGGWTIQ
ncbi:MAG: 3-oxoacyl-ACP reductase FabG [Trueperaceae bacterium]|nr:3-oxoacyl-ACP reductase FabG [Trueperaceae bacterium]